MHLTKTDIQNTPRIQRLNIINAITGIKPANLIGTISDKGETNLAIFSSVVHLGSNPALIGCISRPTGEIERHTYENILANGVYTINHVHRDFVKNAHYTSAKFERHQSEFAHCQLTPEYLDNFKAPFVKESKLKMGLNYRQSIPIELNGTVLIIGEIEHLIIDDQAIEGNDHINLSNIQTVGIGGLDTYYALNKIQQFPYARINELPEDFNA